MYEIIDSFYNLSEFNDILKDSISYSDFKNISRILLNNVCNDIGEIKKTSIKVKILKTKNLIVPSINKTNNSFENKRAIVVDGLVCYNISYTRMETDERVCNYEWYNPFSIILYLNQSDFSNRYNFYIFVESSNVDIIKEGYIEGRCKIIIAIRCSEECYLKVKKDDVYEESDWIMATEKLELVRGGEGKALKVSTDMFLVDLNSFKNGLKKIINFNNYENIISRRIIKNKYIKDYINYDGHLYNSNKICIDGFMLYKIKYETENYNEEYSVKEILRPLTMFFSTDENKINSKGIYFYTLASTIYSLDERYLVIRSVYFSLFKTEFCIYDENYRGGVKKWIGI